MLTCFAIVIVQSRRVHAYRSEANLTDIEVDSSEALRWKRCKIMKSWIGEKRYHMQHTDKGVPVTVLFNRYEKTAELKLTWGKTWKVNLYTPGVNPLREAIGAYKGKLQWETVLAEGFEPEDILDETVSLDHATYIRYVGKSEAHGLPAMLLIGQDGSNTPVVLAGGDYYNDELIRMSMKRINSKERRGGKLTAEVAARQSMGAAGRGQAVSSFGRALGATTGTVATVGSVLGGSVAFLTTGLFVMTTEAVISATMVGAAGGFVAGAGLGVAVGAVGGVATGLVTGIAKFLKFRHEASLTMPEKIFEKLRCHPSFIRCAGDVIYPKSERSKCPKNKHALPGEDQVQGIMQRVQENSLPGEEVQETSLPEEDQVQEITQEMQRAVEEN